MLQDCFAVVTSILRGVEVRLAASKSPRWKGKRLSVWIALLGLAGLLALPEGREARAEPGRKSDESAAGEAAQASIVEGDLYGVLIGRFPRTVGEGGERDRMPRDEALREHPAWKRLDAAWSEAARLTSDRYVRWPFTTKEKSDLVQRLRAGGGFLYELEKAGLLTPAEAGYLLEELDDLVTRSWYLRVSDRVNPSVNPAPAPEHPWDPSVEYFQERLHLLQKLAGQGAVNAEALGKILGCVKKAMKPLLKAREKEAVTFRERIEVLLDRIEAASKAPDGARPRSLAGHPAWQSVDLALRRVQGLRGRYGGWHRPTTEEKIRLLERLVRARRGLDTLVAEKRITEAEAGLVAFEIRAWERWVPHLPEKDRELPYDAAPSRPRPVNAVLVGMKALVDCLPFLEEAAAQDRVTPEVWDVVKSRIRHALENLSHPEALAALLPGRQRQASRLREKVGGLVETLKVRLR